MIFEDVHTVPAFQAFTRKTGSQHFGKAKDIEGLDAESVFNGVAGFFAPQFSPKDANAKLQGFHIHAHGNTFLGKMQGIGEEEIAGKVEDVIKRCALGEKKNAEISTLSKGYRQRVGIAQALIHNPKIIILDEPTTGLDPKQRIEIRDLIKEIGKDRTVILSSHILSEVSSTCSRVIIINRGKIAADGNPEDLENEGKGSALIKIEIKNEPSSLKEKLQSLDSVVAVKSEGGKIDIEVRGDADIRAEVAKTVVESGAGLLALERQETSLEDIFIKLTNQGNE